ncbi:glycoprotein 3-alpha-L-fucosyltransferase A-like [Actinia tenebrosa]|uniref:Fucosyltransferase n=1 Tax=Actinia tenebrosa TaxID=6105 RepID=A0A6P8II49_ACTTE|nr:glycoprotein 3-alpha-L-fucosyltransferase A-like [Actinia tenebrosa]
MKMYLEQDTEYDIERFQGRTENLSEKKFSQKDMAHFKRQKGKQSYQLVLIYTPLFGRLPWRGLETSYNFTHFRGKTCKVTNCRLTYDKMDLARSDVVIFHGRDMPSVNTMKEISQNRTSKQRWVYFMHENPYFTYYKPALYNGFFNWTMTYRGDSDFFVPYNYYSPLASTEKQTTRHLKNYAQGKDKFIAWMVSHCGNLRHNVTAKLLKYVNVTVFGACGKQYNQKNRCNRKTRDCDKLLKRFKFYLSFENRNCIDYVTEKYWYTPFHHDMVPIVLGPLKYDSKIAIPGSYINVMDFPSLKDLASYLKYLDKNDTAYNEYFQWKLKYKIDYPNPWNCQMCADLNNPNLPVKVYNDLDSFWGIKSSCGQYEDRIRELLER